MSNEISLEDAFSNQSDATAPEPTPEPAPETPEPVSAEPAATEATEATPEPAPEAEGGTSPPESAEPEATQPWHIAAVMDERDKRQAAQKDLEAAQAKLKELEAKEPTSFFEDEEKARREILDEVKAEATNALLEMSKRYAVQHHGQEAVDQATEWFNQVAPSSPILLQKFHESGNDIGKVVELYQQDQKFSSLEKADDLRAEMEAKWRAEFEAKFKAEQEQKAESETQKAESIPPSLAKQTSSGDTTKPQDEGLDSYFGG